MFADIQNHFKRVAAPPTTNNDTNNGIAGNGISPTANEQTKKRSRSPSSESSPPKKQCKNAENKEEKTADSKTTYREAVQDGRKSKVELKLEAAAPFNYFLTKV